MRRGVNFYMRLQEILDNRSEELPEEACLLGSVYSLHFQRKKCDQVGPTPCYLKSKVVYAHQVLVHIFKDMS